MPRTVVLITAIDCTCVYAVDAVQVKSKCGDLLDIEGDNVGAVVHANTTIDFANQDMNIPKVSSLDAVWNVPSWMVGEPPLLMGVVE